MDAAPFVSLYLSGPPVGKGRPRFARGRAYTPEKTRAAEMEVKQAAQIAMVGRRPLTCPVRLQIRVWQEPPKSVSAKQRKALLATKPTTKPDLSNVVKLIEDGLNGIVYDDDKRVVDIDATRRYSAAGGVVVHVYALDDDAKLAAQRRAA